MEPLIDGVELAVLPTIGANAGGGLAWLAWAGEWREESLHQQAMLSWRMCRSSWVEKKKTSHNLIE